MLMQGRESLHKRFPSNTRAPRLFDPPAAIRPTNRKSRGFVLRLPLVELTVAQRETHLAAHEGMRGKTRGGKRAAGKHERSIHSAIGFKILYKVIMMLDVYAMLNRESL